MLWTHEKNDTAKIMEVMEWTPPGRRKKGRPSITWREEIQTILRERVIEEEDVYKRQVIGGWGNFL